MLPYCVVQAFSRSKKELRPPPPVRLKGRSQAASVAVIEPSQQCTHRFVLSSLLLLLVLLLFTGFSCLGVVCFVSAFTRVLPLRGQTGIYNSPVWRYSSEIILKSFTFFWYKIESQICGQLFFLVFCLRVDLVSLFINHKLMIHMIQIAVVKPVVLN